MRYCGSVTDWLSYGREMVIERMKFESNMWHHRVYDDELTLVNERVEE